MQTDIELISGVNFRATTESGHEIIMDGPPEFGGENHGARPMELLLVGMGGCTAFDVVHILKKFRQPVTDVKVALTAERAETEPKVFTQIHVHFRVYGEGLDDSKVARAVKLSAEKYCSASIMLGKTANITHDYEVLN